MKVKAKYFINISNHPTSKWSDEQLNAAKRMAETIIDIPFPNIPSTAEPLDIKGLLFALESEIFHKINDIDIGPYDVILHIMGEMGFCFMAISFFKQKYGWRVYHSTTERVVEEKPDGSKVSKFHFVQFREYKRIEEILL